MHNPDRTVKTQEELKAAIQTALTAGDEGALAQAMLDMGNQIQQNILTDAQSMTSTELHDREALAARGVKPLTATERKYYTAIIEGNVDGSAFDGTEGLLPPTVINRVFEELTEKHELLNHINFRQGKATTQWVVKKGDIPLAFWGKLKSETKELLDEGFTTLQMTMYLLTCFIPVGKSMLELGPEWLDRYVREVLAEGMALALENAIVNGDGKDCPIGMIRDMEDANHPQKSAVKLTSLEPVALGANIMAPLSHKGKRTVNDVILIVNPVDYWRAA